MKTLGKNIIVDRHWQCGTTRSSNFIISQYEMLKPSIQCTRFKTHYNNCSGRSSENICNNSERFKAIKKKERRDETQFTTKIGGKTNLCPSFFFHFHTQLVTCLMPYYAETGHSNQFRSKLFRFVKFSFPVTCLMPYYAETSHSRPLIERLYK